MKWMRHVLRIKIRLNTKKKKENILADGRRALDDCDYNLKTSYIKAESQYFSIIKAAYSKSC